MNMYTTIHHIGGKKMTPCNVRDTPGRRMQLIDLKSVKSCVTLVSGLHGSVLLLVV